MHYRVSKRFLVERGLTDYWGYNTLGFFAPDPRLAAAADPHGVVREFKTMVATLHDAGIAVFLDVVYNHTAEGSELGPTLAFRGLDNAAYYHLADDRHSTYDVTGAGNTLNVGHPRTLQLITDSLRYWVSEMHVDGFRFALAPALARNFRGFDKLSAFFDLLLQDPVLAGVHLIAEPWDLGEDGYAVGNFPVNWSEWNGRYRDTVRRFWAGAPPQLGELAARLSGSADLYGADGRRPSASVNFVAVHDGFTLADLVSYERKHNEANRQDNADGTDAHDSWNCGVEGPTSDPAIASPAPAPGAQSAAHARPQPGRAPAPGRRRVRAHPEGQQPRLLPGQRADLAGLGRWDSESRSLVDFTRRLLRLRADEPVFRRRDFFQGRPITGGDVKDIYWIHPAGWEMQQDDWQTPVQSLGVLLVGEQISERDEQCRPITGNSYLVLLNAADGPVEFVLPARLAALEKQVVLDTVGTDREAQRVKESYDLPAHAAAVLLVTRPPA